MLSEMAFQCPGCMATLEDASRPCEWCGHAPPGGSTATEAREPPKEVDTAPPPPDYATKAKAEPIVIPKNKPPRVTVTTPPARPTPLAAATPAAAETNDRPTAPPPPPLEPPHEGLPPPVAEPFARGAARAMPPTPARPFAPAADPRPTPAAVPVLAPIINPSDDHHLGELELPGTSDPPAPPVASLAPSFPAPSAATPGNAREQILDGGALEAPIALELDRHSAPVADAPSARAAPAPMVLRGRAPERPPLDPAEVRMVARYGVTPDTWWSTPMYVRQVRARQVELAKELAAAEDECFAAQTALDDALVALGQRAIAEVRNTARARGPHLKTFDRIAQRDAALKAVDSGLFEDSEKHRDTMRALHDKIEGAKAQLQTATSKEAAAALLALQQERDATERGMKVPATSADEEVQRARVEFRATCVDFADAVLEDRAGFGEDYEEPRARVARLRNAVEAAEKKVLLHRAAENAFDENAMATGTRVFYGAIGLALLSMALLAFAIK